MGWDGYGCGGGGFWVGTSTFVRVFATAFVRVFTTTFVNEDGHLREDRGWRLERCATYHF